jgi:hypothetical protein
MRINFYNKILYIFIIRYFWSEEKIDVAINPNDLHVGKKKYYLPDFYEYLYLRTETITSVL